MTQSIETLLSSPLTASGGPRLRRTSQLLSLEQRFMFDGAAAVDAAHAADAPPPPPVPPAVTVREAEPAKDAGKKEVVLVDTSVKDYKTLEAGIRDGVGIVEFDGSKDGLAQIAAWASTQSGLDAIHILSHGSESNLLLGTTTLSTASLSDATTQTELTQLGSALTADGDLLLYGCDVGDNTALLNGLAQATGADVAASTDATGAARLGGNWTLEKHVGDIDSRELAIVQYDGVLAATTITFTDADADPGGATTSLDYSVAGTTITFSGPQLYTYTHDGLYGLQGLGPGGSSTLITISVASGYSFDITSLHGVATTGEAHFQVTLADGSIVDYDQSGFDTVSSGTVAGFAALDDITKVVITSNDYSAFQNIVIDDVKAIGPTTTVSNVQISNDSNINTDFITNSAAQTITATLSGVLGGTDILQGSTDNGASWTNVTSSVSGTTLTWTGATLAGGSSNILLKVTNSGGADGAVVSQAYTLDTTPPATPPAPTLNASSDTGALNSDKITKDTTPTLSGTAEAGSTVTIYDGATQLGTAVATGGVWSFTTSTLTAGSHFFTTTAKDTAGNVSAASAGLNVTLDTSAPTVSSVSVPSAGSYGVGSTLSFVVHNNETTTVDTAGGTPRLAIDVGGVTRYATYTSGSGSSDLVFTYTVQAGDNDGDGITLANSSLASNGGALADLAGNNMVTTLASIGATTAVLVDTTAPAVSSVGVPANGTYYTGQSLQFTVNFGEAVTVNTAGGTPSISVVVGATNRQATYVSGSGTSALTFSYTVVNGDVDADGITIGSLALNSGTIKDNAGNNATLTLNSVGSAAGIDVDGSNPSITNISASTADGSYGAGQTITLTVDFSSAVSVDTTGGTPTLALDGGGTATYTGGSGTGTLTFSYTVAAGQNSADLDVSSTNALALNGATIVEAGGAHQTASLTLATPGTAGSLGANKDIIIDTAAPTNTVATASFSADTGTLNNDFITRTAAQTIFGTLSTNLAAGEHVYVSLDNGGTWNVATASVGSNAWSLNGQTLTGSSTLQVRVVDDANNTGAAYVQAYVLDTTAPTITISNLALSADHGSSNTDFVTDQGAQTISATLSAAPAAGDVVYGSIDGGSTWTDITSQVSGTTLTWTGVTLVGSNTLQLRVADTAGNNGVAASQAYVIDTSAPTTTVATVGFDHDSGVSSSDFITNVAAQTVSGTLTANLAAGESVQVSLDNGATWSLATASVGSDSWLLAGQTLSASDTLLVKVSSAAGADGAVLSQAYVYDTHASVPAVDALQTPSATPVLTGNATLAAGETLTITVGGATYDVVPVAGAWSLDLASAVPASGALTLVLGQQYEVIATVTDLAGNTSSDTSSGELIVGTLPSPPPPPSAGDPTTFQTPPVYPDPVPPIPSAPSFLPTGTNDPTPPPFTFGTDSGWQSTSLLHQALQPDAALSGGLAELMSATTLPALMGGGDSLSARAPIDNVAVASGERISMQVNADAFMHNQPGQNVRLSAELADGRPLPTWLKFNARDGRFEGVAPPGFTGKITVRIIARDGLGHEASQQFDIVIGRDIRTQASTSAPDSTGRSSLSQQLRDARGTGVSGLASVALSAVSGTRIL